MCDAFERLGLLLPDFERAVDDKNIAEDDFLAKSQGLIVVDSPDPLLDRLDLFDALPLRLPEPERPFEQ